MTQYVNVKMQQQKTEYHEEKNGDQVWTWAVVLISFRSTTNLTRVNFCHFACIRALRTQAPGLFLAQQNVWIYSHLLIVYKDQNQKKSFHRCIMVWFNAALKLWLHAFNMPISWVFFSLCFAHDLDDVLDL